LLASSILFGHLAPDAILDLWDLVLRKLGQKRIAPNLNQEYAELTVALISVLLRKSTNHM
jgi:hypothetical protein